MAALRRSRMVVPCSTLAKTTARGTPAINFAPVTSSSASVIYDYPSGNASGAAAALPYFAVRRYQAGRITNGPTAKRISAIRASVSDWNSDGYDDIAIGSKSPKNQKRYV